MRTRERERDGKKGERDGMVKEGKTNIAAPIRLETEKNIPTKGRDSRREAANPKPGQRTRRGQFHADLASKKVDGKDLL